MTERRHRPWIAAVALKHTGDSCLLWPFAVRGGRRPQDAYPALGGNGYAHVYICELVHGGKPTLLHEAEHTCGIKLCVNPSHLQWALHKANCARRTAHGTQTIGERHGMVVLTEAQALAIRATPRVHGSGVALAAQYGVSTATVSLIRSGKQWKHLPCE